MSNSLIHIVQPAFDHINNNHPVDKEQSNTLKEFNEKSSDFFNYIINILKNKNFDSALENFINVIRLNRQFDDDGARKACIAIFKYLGEEHEITQRHRRDFGSALYV